MREEEPAGYSVPVQWRVLGEQLVTADICTWNRDIYTVTREIKQLREFPRRVVGVT